jgi:hypothetical protein
MASERDRARGGLPMVRNLLPNGLRHNEARGGGGCDRLERRRARDIMTTAELVAARAAGRRRDHRHDRAVRFERIGGGRRLLVHGRASVPLVCARKERERGEEDEEQEAQHGPAGVYTCWMPRNAEAFPAGVTSGEDVLRTGNEQARAASLAPHTLIGRIRLCAVVVAGIELALVDPKLAVEKMQLFHTAVRMRRILAARRQAHQHADDVALIVGGEQLARDAGRDFLPVRLVPLRLGGKRDQRIRLGGDAAR